VFLLQIFDARDKLIEIGGYVRYVGTGTVGKVEDLKIENNNQWVKFEDPQLWYSHELLEVLDSKHIKTETKKDRGNGEIDVDALKDIQEELENAELDSNVAEGGG
jgi:hypothetical protein